MRFISVLVCYSLACNAGVKVSIPGSIHQVLARNLIKGNTISFHALDRCRSRINTMKTIEDTKFQQSIAELFSVDNLPNVVYHFFQSAISFTCLKRRMMLRGEQTELQLL